MPANPTANNRTHSFGSRYEIHDPETSGVVEHAAKLQFALARAETLADRYGHRMVVYDRMAHRNAPDQYIVDPGDAGAR